MFMYIIICKLNKNISIHITVSYMNIFEQIVSTNSGIAG